MNPLMRNLFFRIIALPKTGYPKVAISLRIAVAIGSAIMSAQGFKTILREQEHFLRLRRGEEVSQISRSSIFSLHMERAITSQAVRFFRQEDNAPAKFILEQSIKIAHKGLQRAFRELIQNRNLTPAQHPVFAYTWESPRALLSQEHMSQEDKDNRRRFSNTNQYLVLAFDESFVTYTGSIWLLGKPYVLYRIGALVVRVGEIIVPVIYYKSVAIFIPEKTLVKKRVTRKKKPVTKKIVEKKVIEEVTDPKDEQK